MLQKYRIWLSYASFLVKFLSKIYYNIEYQYDNFYNKLVKLA